jgi:hypothetical protein
MLDQIDGSTNRMALASDELSMKGHNMSLKNFGVMKNRASVLFAV